MKQVFPVLILIVGLGCCFSFSQINPSKDPFARYLAGVKAGTPELALQRFATECNVNVSKAHPRNAVGPGSSFAPVKDLAMGLRSVESDFYSTAEVWTAEDRVLVEIWANSDDVGSEVRYLECFVNRKLVQSEVIEWHVPVSQSPHIVPWGYSRRWERGDSGRMQRTKAEFVDEMEHAIPKPKLDAEDEKSLKWMPHLGSLSELPPSMFR